MSTIVIVEDDPNTVEIVKLYLGHDGHEVISAGDGIEGLTLIRNNNPNLVVLDLMLPGMSGQDICRIIRRESDVPVIMLTARVEEEDRLEGFDLGADDYMSKPFSPRELAARVRAVLRRATQDQNDHKPVTLEYDEVIVNTREQTLEVRGDRIHATATELRMLTLFMGNVGRVYSRNQIIQQVFGYDFEGYDRTVDAHISNLRSKIEVDPNKPQYINTVYGMGYRFGHV